MRLIVNESYINGKIKLGDYSYSDLAKIARKYKTTLEDDPTNKDIPYKLKGSYGDLVFTVSLSSIGENRLTIVRMPNKDLNVFKTEKYANSLRLIHSLINDLDSILSY